MSHNVWFVENIFSSSSVTSSVGASSPQPSPVDQTSLCIQPISCSPLTDDSQPNTSIFIPDVFPLFLSTESRPLILYFANFYFFLLGLTCAQITIWTSFLLCTELAHYIFI
jgi:hypothetical protein